jgi:hypothetical protein
MLALHPVFQHDAASLKVPSYGAGYTSRDGPGEPVQLSSSCATIVVPFGVKTFTIVSAVV